MFGVNRPIRFVVALLLGCYLFLYPGSIVLVALDKVPVWGTWMGGGLLILLGSLAGIWLIANFGRWGAVASAWVLFLSWLVEHVGATTGFPFGSYSYTDVLQPQIFGVVPLAIPFAWLLIVTAAMGTAELLLERDGRAANADLRVSPSKVLTAAAFALLLDVTIEPFAVHINQYWVWSNSADAAYYGIPASNFVAWWVTSLLLSWVLLLHRQRAARAAIASHAPRPEAFWPWLPLTLYLTNLTMFVVVNLGRGQEAAAVIGALILLALAGHRVVPGLLRFVRGANQESGA
jgi:putative membrane protein